MIAFYYVLVAVLGLCIGSFLNVVIYRTPRGMSLIKPNSHCPNCNTPIKWYDNIPVLSYILLGGKCRNCKCKISPRYILVEILNAVLWVLCFYLFGGVNIYLAVGLMIFSSCLICVALIDLENMIILDRFQIVILLIGVLLCLFPNNVVWWERLIGFAVGGGSMLLFYLFGYLVFKKESLGFGDVKLMAGCGLVLGYKAIILAVVVSVVVGAIVLAIINGKSKGKEYPFAPFLCFGTLIAVFMGDIIINGYLSLL